MTRTRSFLAAVVVTALLSACGSSGSVADAGSASPTSGSPTATSSESASASETPSGSASPSESGSGSPRPVPTSLQALQLCAITLAYATGALAGAPDGQMKTLEEGIASARQKATPAEAELAAQAGVVVDAIKAGDQAAVSASGKQMGLLCGSG